MPNFDHLDELSAAVIRLLREERDAQGVSGKQLAKLCGLNQSTISLTDRGLRKPTLETLLRLAVVLRIDLGEILTKAGREVREKDAPKKEEAVKARSRRAG